MRLIEVAGAEGSVQDGTSARKRACCVTRPLDLLVATERHAGDAAKMALNGTSAHPVDIALGRRIGRTAPRDDSRARQSGNEYLRVVIGRNIA